MSNTQTIEQLAEWMMSSDYCKDSRAAMIENSFSNGFDYRLSDQDALEYRLESLPEKQLNEWLNWKEFKEWSKG